MSSATIAPAKIVFCDRSTLGSHIGVSKTLLDTVRDGHDQGMYSIQFFCGSRMSFNRKKFSSSDLANTKKFLAKTDLNVFTHLPYTYNFAGSKKEGILNWSGNKERDEKATNMCLSVEHELRITSSVCGDCRKSGCVLHIGSWDDSAVGLKTIGSTINKINFPDHSTLLLETMVGRGSVLGQSYGELLTVYNGVREEKQPHIKICIDTCHVFANGQYDLRTGSGMERMFSEFEETFPTGFEMLGLIHLNDSDEKFDSNKDLHARIGQGHIWGDDLNKSVLVRLLDKIDELGTPTVLETVQDDYPIVKNL